MAELMRGMAKLPEGQTLETAEEWYVVLGKVDENAYSIGPVNIKTGDLLGCPLYTKFDTDDMDLIYEDYCHTDWHWVKPGTKVTARGRKLFVSGFRPVGRCVTLCEHSGYGIMQVAPAKPEDVTLGWDDDDE